MMHEPTKSRGAWFAAAIAGLLLFVWVAHRSAPPREAPPGQAPDGAGGDGASDTTPAASQAAPSHEFPRAGEARSSTPAPTDPRRESAQALPSPSEAPPPNGRLDTSLQGALLWDASVDARDFGVTCRRAGEQAEQNVYLGPDGRFRRFAMEPGRVDVLVRMRGEENPLVTISGVAISGAGPADDPRLRAIDVTAVKRVVLTFVDAQGDPIVATLHALVLWPDGQTGRHVRTAGGRDGKLRVLVQGNGGLSTVWADGYACRTMELHGDQTVVLLARTLVRVRVKGPTLRVHLVPSGWEGVVLANPHAFDTTDGDERDPEEMRVADIPVATLLEWHHDKASASYVWTFAVTKTGEYEAYCTKRVRGGEDDTKLGSRKVVVRDLAEDQEVEIAVQRAESPDPPAKK